MPLTETAEALIRQYFDAFSYLYGIISMKRALRIITRQNPELAISEEDFRAFASDLDFHRVHYVIAHDSEFYSDEPCPETDFFKQMLVADHLIDLDTEAYDEIKATQDGYRFYVPPRDELLRYADEKYFEQNAAVTSMREFLQTELRLGDSLIGDLLDDWHITMIVCTKEDEFTDEYFEIVDEMSRITHKAFRDFKNYQQEEEFQDRLNELYNTMRLPMYRGHTPREVNQGV